MNKPWVLIATGVSGLLVVGLLVKRFTGSDDPDPLALQRQVASVERLRGASASGFAARPENSGAPAGTGGVRDHAGTGVAEKRRAAGEDHGSGAAGRSGDAADAIYGTGRRSMIGSGAGTNAAGSGAGEVGSAMANPQVPFEGARSLNRPGFGHGGLGTQNMIVPAETDPEQDQADETGLVLSLPLENSTEPTKGDTSPVVAEGVKFDAEGAKFDTDSQFVIPNAGNISGEAGSIAFNIQPEWDGADGTDASLVQLREQNRFENRLQITKNGQFLRFIFADNTGVESGAGYDISNWKQGERHQVTATWGEALTTLYVDGQKVGQQTYTGQLELAANTPLYVGSDYKGNQPGARATMSQFQVYNRPLAPDEVGSIVTKGLK